MLGEDRLRQHLARVGAVPEDHRSNIARTDARLKWTISPDDHPMSTRREYTLIYDGDCDVCTRTIEQLRRWDVNEVVELLPSQDASVPQRFPQIPRADYDEAMQLVDGRGNVWAGAAAIEQLLTLLPRTGLFRALFRIPGMRRLADHAYRWVARNRYRLGCSQHCATAR
jgi:predicted DCC family thiol-disulfide oxidoreductase YuxK